MQNVFRNKNFVLIFFGALVSNIVSLFYSFAVSYWILDITNNNAIIQGAYLGVCGITFVLFSLIGGVLSDRFNKAKLMYICDYIKGILIIVSSIIIWLSKDNVIVSIVLLFVLGIVSNVIASIFGPASTSLLPLILEKQQLQQANSYMSVLSNLQAIIGLFVAGLLYATLPITTIFIIVGICYVISAISEMFIKYEHRQNENKLTLKTALLDIKEGFMYVKGQKALTSLLVIVILCNFFLTPVNSNFITYFIKTDVTSNPNYLFHEFINPEMWGAMISIVISISSIIFGIIISLKPLGENTGKSIKKWLALFSLIIIGMAVFYIVLVDKKDLLNTYLILLLVGAFLMGMSLSFINIPISTVIQTITDQDKLGKVSSITNMISQGLVPIATFAAGFIIEYLGSSSLLIVCSIGFLITAIMAIFNKSINKFNIQKKVQN